MSNSVNTNIGALLGQKYLRGNAADMVVVQNRVSSGLRVASVTDDASTYAVAAGMRGDIKGYTAIAGALQGAKIGAQVAVSAGETISKRLEEIKAQRKRFASLGPQLWQQVNSVRLLEIGDTPG
jgi:flagellin